jgi:hypothetical protein
VPSSVFPSSPGFVPLFGSVSPEFSPSSPWPGFEEKPGDLKIDLDDQRDELKRISAEINHISDGLKASPGSFSGTVNAGRSLFIRVWMLFNVSNLA